MSYPSAKHNLRKPVPQWGRANDPKRLGASGNYEASIGLGRDLGTGGAGSVSGRDGVV